MSVHFEKDFLVRIIVYFHRLLVVLAPRLISAGWQQSRDIVRPH